MNDMGGGIKKCTPYSQDDVWGNIEINKHGHFYRFSM